MVEPSDNLQAVFEKAIETARNMIAKGLDLDLIRDCTGLSLSDLQKLV